MKKLILLTLILLFAQFNLVLAEHENICQELLTGKDFGNHVSMHAQEMHFNGEMNPGVHHQGYSICVP